MCQGAKIHVEISLPVKIEGLFGADRAIIKCGSDSLKQ